MTDAIFWVLVVPILALAYATVGVVVARTLDHRWALCGLLGVKECSWADLYLLWGRGGKCYRCTEGAYEPFHRSGEHTSWSIGAGILWPATFVLWVCHTILSFCYAILSFVGKGPLAWGTWITDRVDLWPPTINREIDLRAREAELERREAELVRREDQLGIQRYDTESFITYADRVLATDAAVPAQ
jgi:hypothetical protein